MLSKQRVNTQIGFVLKVILLSAVLSLLIKYGGVYLPLQATTTTALVMVLTPSIALGLILGWRYRQLSSSSK